MIVSYKHFDLQNMPILEKVVFHAPLKADSTMNNAACFLHVIKGNSKLYSGEGRMNLETKDSLVMKCGTYLNNWFPNKDQSPSEAVFVHFNPEILKLVYKDHLPELLAGLPEKAMSSVEKIKLNALIDNYVKSLLFYFENPQLVSDDLIKIKVKEIVLLLAKTDRASQIKAIFSDLFNPTQYKFKEVIEANIFEDLRLQDLAVITGYSLSSFKRKFRSVFNMSPTQYIKMKRLEKAQEKLEKTDDRISDIAFDVGFNDLGYFSKSFSNLYNCSPTEYRKRLHANS